MVILWRQWVYFLITWRWQVVTGVVFQQFFWLIRTILWPENRKRSRRKKNSASTNHASNLSAASCQPYLGKALPDFLSRCYEMKFYCDSPICYVLFVKYKDVRTWPLFSCCLCLSNMFLRMMGQSSVFQTDFDKWTKSELCSRNDIILSNFYIQNILP